MPTSIARTIRNGFVLFVVAVALQTPTLLAAEPKDKPAAKTSARRLREGETIREQLGTFRLVGERYWFTPHDGAPMCVLENLSLQRVAQLVKEWGESRVWEVSGTVTEYQDENLLLLDHAIMKAKNVRELPGSEGGDIMKHKSATRPSTAR